MKTKTALLLIALALAALPPAAAGEKRVSGYIERETRWKAEEGPFIIEGDLLVRSYANLVIAPGTKIIIAAQTAPKSSFLAPPLDRADSSLVSIRIQGGFNCVGKRDNPITFEPEISGLANYAWRGIILDKSDNTFTEIAFTNISGAATGVTVRNASPILRNNAIENCNIGIQCVEGIAPRVYNNLITNCFTAAIKIERSNPQILNNIIVFNNNVGLWCDNKSKITFKYNCVYGNGDGNFLDCDPELGRSAKNKDSTDAMNNIIKNPVFAGSQAESRAIELDINLPTDSSKVKNTKLLSIPKFQFGPKVQIPDTKVGSESTRLSKYSPCINTGDPGGAFKNADGTRNTMGPAGGQDFFAK